MRVVPASIDEWPQIDALRKSYFAARGSEVQKRQNVSWVVALRAKQVTGCYSFTDAPEYDQRWLQDFYVVPGRFGVLAAHKMMEHARENARIDGLVLGGVTEPDNVRQQRFGEKQGWRLIGLMYMQESGT